MLTVAFSDTLLRNEDGTGASNSEGELGTFLLETSVVVSGSAENEEVMGLRAPVERKERGVPPKQDQLFWTKTGSQIMQDGKGLGLSRQPVSCRKLVLSNCVEEQCLISQFPGLLPRSRSFVPWDPLSTANSSEVTEFLLLGFSSLGDVQLVLFVIFLCLYLIILSGNVTIISVIHLDRSLHTPMYFFLSVLSTSEIFYTIVILPKMLINLLSVLRTLSFASCAIQMFFFLGFAVTNCLLLGVMGYDRYTAICHPLRYPILMSWRICGQLAATCILSGFLISLMGTTLVFTLPFCGPNKVNHYFCDISPVIRLACAETYINELVIFICGVFVLVVPLTFICISYGFIVRTILRIPSTEGKRKAFSTCASHLIVVIIHYGCASSVYLRPSAKHSSGKDRLVTVTYTVVTPLLNPMVYSLRNKDVQMAIRKVIGKAGVSLKTF
ncbi:olfactory receptor 10R2-like [Sorex araneus]|uniref:olfactory receptor 10R2-like n=1 Tax=Sorex araneus TaxID=42254 RepID=UPI00243336C8|nr:olfactory receptor 10R2-like [Sorex araneus]